MSDDRLAMTSPDDVIDERRENAYRIVIALSLSASLICAVLLSTLMPSMDAVYSGVNERIEADAFACETSTRELLSIISISMSNSSDISRLRTPRKADKASKIGPPGKLTAEEEEDDCKCEFPPGPPGLPGRAGLAGTPGARGAPGEPARLPCEPPLDIAKICADPCPVGVQGPAGPQGISGERGPPGVPGRPGVRGLNGKYGRRGDRGTPGIPGLNGDVGKPGADASPSPFVPGPPGPEGERGPYGVDGPLGMPGEDGPIGPPGPRGKRGRDGLPGVRGEQGQPGAMGDGGAEGRKGVCPTYCATDGGVFFVQPPSWFFQ